MDFSKLTVMPSALARSLRVVSDCVKSSGVKSVEERYPSSANARTTAVSWICAIAVFTECDPKAK